MINPRLCIGLDALGALRELTRQGVPDPVEAVFASEGAGAEGISMGWREDRHYITERDLKLARQVCRTHFNLETFASQETLRLALELKPHSLTFCAHVADTLAAQPFDLVVQHEKLESILPLLREAQVQPRLLLEPESEVLRLAHRAGCEAIELSPARYAQANTLKARQSELEKLLDAAKVAAKLRMRVFIGGGCDSLSLRSLSGVAEIDGFKSGPLLAARALQAGWPTAVAEWRGMVGSYAGC